MAGKTVVITGASSGIGAACALHLDKEGFRVFAGVRRQSDAEALRAKASPRLTPVSLDIADTLSISTAAGAVAGAVGETGLDGLVNNAGV
ncbi:MAG TPA: SDR family NAD(P)-dependent oxidoreductase, partial [Methylomirabilota bacterium]|nr:SDR family NAD(P)-dependent oxidoreductase [Methylomirabilota bacterium]